MSRVCITMNCVHLVIGHRLEVSVTDKSNRANPFLWNYDVLLDGISMKKLAEKRTALMMYRRKNSNEGPLKAWK